jgi:hypothetical protein
MIKGSAAQGVLRILTTSACLAMSCCLLVGAYCSSRFAAKDWEFVLQSPWMDPWARTWIRRGDTARFENMDTDGAVEAYWQGVARNPLLLGAWFALARLLPQLDEEAKVKSLHDVLLAHVPPSTPWRWHQLMLAADKKDEATFTEGFNHVLSRLPRHRQEAVILALDFWGGWNEILSRTMPENRWFVFQECMARKLVDTCMELYAVLEKDQPDLLNTERKSRFIEFLLENRSWAEAADLLRRSDMFQDSLVINGQFQTPLTQEVFGWRRKSVEGVDVSIEPLRGKGGESALRIHFLGTNNPRYDHFWQYVPLRPGIDYELRFSWKADQLTTDQGVFVELRGMDCDRFRVQSPVILGSRDWTDEAFSFRTPQNCRMARIGLRRNESLKFDNKIAGNVWLDAVTLIEKHNRPLDRD